MRDILLSSLPTFRQIILLQFFCDKDTSRLVDDRPFCDNPNFILATQGVVTSYVCVLPSATGVKSFDHQNLALTV